MSKLNISINLNTYSDRRASNAPSLVNFKWNRTINGIDAENPTGMTVTLAASETRTLFDGETPKKFIYLETDGEISYIANDNSGENPDTIKPIVINDSIMPGILLRSSDINKLVVTNLSSTKDVTIFLAVVE